MAATTSLYTCPLCSGFQFTAYKLWLGHLRHVHSHDPSFHVTCGIDSCPVTYRNFSALYSHVYRKHRHMIEAREKVLPSGVGGTVRQDVAADTEPCMFQDETMDMSECTAADVERLMGTDTVARQRKSALFLLKMKEKRLLPQAAIDDMIEETTALFDRTFTMLKAGIREKLSSCNVDVNLDSVFINLSDPFEGLKTQYYQEKYFKESLNLIEPKEIKVGEVYTTTQFTGSKQREVERYDTYYYVPILQTLENLLSDSCVQDEVDNTYMRIHSDSKLEDFCDGHVFKEHPLFSSNPTALQIVCYYDELELVNPLGAYVKKHKIGVGFFILGNIQPKYRSRLRSVNLAFVCKVEVVEKHGIKKILQPLIEDLNKLATEGITVSVNGIERNYKGALIAFLADTPASHLIGGFKKSVSCAFRPCRTCLASTHTFKEKFNSKYFQKRTVENHKHQCDKLTTAGSLYEHYSMLYGINERSALFDVKDFSMLNWGLPHDVMYDCFEGVVQYEIKLLLLHCISSKYFTLDEFNRRLLAFDYGYTEVADKPIAITTQHIRSKTGKHLRQGSAQAWLLARILPLLIGYSIPESDVHWQCYSKLLRIISIALAPVVTLDACSVLKVLIEEHHTCFKALYPEWTIVPKMHYMLHYPEQILAIGPLIRAWTMRYEAKLHVLKCAGRISNFKNVCQTVSFRHQRWMCYELAAGGVLSTYMETGPAFGSVQLRDEVTLIKEQIFKIVPQISSDIQIHRSSWVKINGIVYKPLGGYILYNISGHDLVDPTLLFGFIEEIIIVSATMVLFVVSKHESDYFDDHFYSYVVRRSSERVVISYDKLADPNVYHCHSVAGKQYIKLKHYLCL